MIVAGLLIGLLALDQFVIPPLVDGWKGRAQRIERLRADIARGEGLVSREAALARRWSEMVENSLPVREADAENLLFRVVADWAREAQLAVASQRPQWMTDEDGVRRLEFRINGAGSIESIARFLYHLESAPHALRVEEMDLSARDERGRTLAINLRLSGIVLRDHDTHES